MAQAKEGRRAKSEVSSLIGPAMVLPMLTVAFTGLVIVVSMMANMGWGRPMFDLLKSVPGADKTGHLILMGVLAFLVNLCLLAKRIKIFSRPVLKGSAIVVIIVTLEEFSQMLIPRRNFSLSDLLCDYIGIFLFGQLAALLIRRVQR